MSKILLPLALLLVSTSHLPGQEPTPKGTPLPFHTIEGYGGGAITPIAYLVNGPANGATWGLPSAAFSYVHLGDKNLEAFTVTENLGGRVEFGFGADRFDLGTLPGAIRAATTVDIQHNQEWLTNFNARVLVVPENSFHAPVPAVTIGAHYKHNDSIADIDQRLGGALQGIGYRKDSGFEFTQTLSKTLPDVGGRPLILTAGARESKAANLGFLGFTDTYKTTLEGNVVFLPANWLLFAYEYRQKPKALNEIPGLINQESDWHAFDASWIFSPHGTLVAGYGRFGNLANSKADSAWWLQLKYEP